eukprot:4025501-Alexandrium_andersonii.AAC.1
MCGLGWVVRGLDAQELGVLWTLQQASSTSWAWMLDSEAACTEHGELLFSPPSSGGRQSKNSDAER